MCSAATACPRQPHPTMSAGELAQQVRRHRRVGDLSPCRHITILHPETEAIVHHHTSSTECSLPPRAANPGCALHRPSSSIPDHRPRFVTAQRPPACTHPHDQAALASRHAAWGTAWRVCPRELDDTTCGAASSGSRWLTPSARTPATPGTEIRRTERSLAEVAQPALSRLPPTCRSP